MTIPSCLDKLPFALKKELTIDQIRVLRAGDESLHRLRNEDGSGTAGLGRGTSTGTKKETAI